MKHTILIFSLMFAFFFQGCKNFSELKASEKTEKPIPTTAFEPDNCKEEDCVGIADLKWGMSREQVKETLKAMTLDEESSTSHWRKRDGLTENGQRLIFSGKIKTQEESDKDNLLVLVLNFENDILYAVMAAEMKEAFGIKIYSGKEAMNFAKKMGSSTGNEGFVSWNAGSDTVFNLNFEVWNRGQSKIIYYSGPKPDFLPEVGVNFYHLTSDMAKKLIAKEYVRKDFREEIVYKKNCSPENTTKLKIKTAEPQKPEENSFGFDNCKEEECVGIADLKWGMSRAQVKEALKHMKFLYEEDSPYKIVAESIVGGQSLAYLLPIENEEGEEEKPLTMIVKFEKDVLVSIITFDDDWGCPMSKKAKRLAQNLGPSLGNNGFKGWRGGSDIVYRADFEAWNKGRSKIIYYNVKFSDSAERAGLDFYDMTSKPAQEFASREYVRSSENGESMRNILAP